MSGPRATEAPLQGACISASSGAIDQSVCPATLKYRVGVCVSTPPLIAILLLLAGCVSDPPKPIIGELRTVTVEVPIKVACINSKDLPQRPQSAMPPPDADIARKSAGAVADAKAYATYSDQLDAAIKACIAAGGPHE